MDDLTSILDWIESGIKLYPNPVNNELILDFSGSEVQKTKIDLIDLSGGKIRHIQKLPENIILNLNVSDIEAGTYIIRIQMDKKIRTKFNGRTAIRCLGLQSSC